MGSLARDQYLAGNLDKARNTLNEAVRLNPKNAALFVLSAKIYIEQNQLEAAERELRIARAHDEKNAEADYLSGIVYQRWQKSEDAMAFYTSASDKQPAELAYVLARAEMHVAMGQLDEALAYLNERTQYFEHSAVIRDAVGQILFQQGKFTEAAEMFRQASILKTDDLGIRERLAMSQYLNHQYREAGDGFARLLRNESHQGRVDLHLALGECQLAAGRVMDARASFETASRLDPSSKGAWMAITKVATLLNDHRRAELSVRKAIALDGSDPEAHLMYGYVLLHQNKLSEAMVCFQKASSLDPKDPVALCMVGYVYEKLGQTDTAIQFYARALQIRPKDELASKLMASIQAGE
jgi:Flp pilus assembly protein TadD